MQDTRNPAGARARRYTQLGYERLLSYRAPSGGFRIGAKETQTISYCVCDQILERRQRIRRRGRLSDPGSGSWVVNQVSETVIG